ncbi:MAG: helix-turn-helix transcriptional regulator [Candidatus Latescibacteria bacterium]|nr:helix-turn-helix transcriptional regulator [Candidatus Latescibacterota bacterium]
MSPLLVEIGKKIRELRKSKELTQERLAEKADLHPTYVGSIERGEVNVSINTLQKTADALEVTIETLFPFDLRKEPTTETELLTSQILGLVRSEPPHIQKVLLNVLKSLIAELRKMG